MPKPRTIDQLSVPSLSLALSIGYSAVVASRLKDISDTGVIIVNLCGASSTGKTTAEQLLVSPFACPRISNKDSLIKTFSSTTNALYAGMSGINGLPIVLDDVTTAPYIDLAEYVQSLSIDSLYSIYEKSQKTVDSLMLKRDNLTDRLASKYAIIHLTITLMDEFFRHCPKCRRTYPTTSRTRTKQRSGARHCS